ncbi:MAG: ABC transporter permease [Clostridia bacterium]|nr:ABC transporter permease [Clostridia bacterium]
MYNRMSDLLYCEFYKINRKHTLLKLAIAVVVIALALMGISALLSDLLSGMSITGGLADYDAQIESLKMEMEAVQQVSGWTDKLIIGNTVAKYKAQITILEYLKAHSVPSGSTMAYSVEGGMGIFGFDLFNFTNFCMSVLMDVVVIFLIVACCRSTCGEYASGAMKMQLLRPINKNKFFTAKWLSVVIISEALTIISFLLSLILGIILYGPTALNVAFVAGSAVTIVPPMAALMITLLINMVQVFAYTQATMFICSLCNTYGKSIVISLLLIVFGFGTYLEYILALPYVGYLAFFANSNWASGISIDAPIFKGMTIWVMIPVTLLWCAFFMWWSYRRFNKKEV